ncbi:MAG: serine hydrolase, partial [Brevundimonas sp.]|nr:serine hydrolase [Brevundimonas sp.]
MRLKLVVCLLAAFAPAVAQAQAPVAAPPPAVRAMAAGYKALMVCSALKTAEAAGGVRTLESVETHELVGVYSEIDAIVREMPVEIGERQVSVPWDAAMPPRTAVYSPGQGCAIQPVGWAGESPEMILPGVRENESFVVAEPRGNAALLNEAVQGAFEGAYGEGVNTTAVLVLQADRVVAEEYGEGFGVDTPQRTWSVGKSLAGTIIGAAVHRGEVDVNAPAAIADWSRPGDPRAAITLDQLMRMASGLTSDTAGNRTDALYFGGVGIDEQ